MTSSFVTGLTLEKHLNHELNTNNMPKELLTLELERDNLQQKWGFTIQGGADLALTAKVASVKVKLFEN